MGFLTQRFVPNTIDVVKTGRFPSTIPALRAELLSDHRISSRKFVTDFIPKGGIGAELGVFTGLFSTILLRHTAAERIYFVDPWWEAFGEHYPDWGTYTGNGKLRTRSAYEAATSRIGKLKKRTQAEIIVGTADVFLKSVPDGYLDWVYLDSTHSYEGTQIELDLLKDKLKPGGVVVGDDWHDDAAHPHSGVSKAVREAVLAGHFEMIGTFDALQWAIRSTDDHSVSDNG